MAILVVWSSKIWKFCREPTKHYSYKVTIHFASWFRRETFLKIQPIRNKNCPWRQCFCPIEMEWGNLIYFSDASCKTNIILPSGFWGDYDEMSNLNRGTAICASYKVSVHLAKWFQRTRFKCVKNNRHQVMILASDCCFRPTHQSFSYIMARSFN